MIRNETEYKEYVRRLKGAVLHVEGERAALLAQGLPEDRIARALEPLLAYQAEIGEELEQYRALKKGQVPELIDLTQLGQWIIMQRIAKGVSQREMAARLGVSEAAVSQDERNEYHNITVERAQRILDKLGVEFTLQDRAQLLLAR
jgi:DNA-binding CsgD family transcriptional regulator